MNEEMVAFKTYLAISQKMINLNLHFEYSTQISGTPALESTIKCNLRFRQIFCDWFYKSSYLNLLLLDLYFHKLSFSLKALPGEILDSIPANTTAAAKLFLKPVVRP